MDEKSYKQYVKKYAKKHGISQKEAEKHAVVKEAAKYYNQNNDTTRTCGWKENET